MATSTRTEEAATCTTPVPDYEALLSRLDGFVEKAHEKQQAHDATKATGKKAHPIAASAECA